MNDPSSAFNAPPPRYLLESDSSDEEGQGGYPGASGSNGRLSGKRAAPCAELARVEGWTRGRAVTEAIIGVGQAGRFSQRKFGLTGTNGARIMLGENKVGEVIEKGGVAVISVEEQDGEQAWGLVRGLIEAVRADKWTVITTYLPSTYITLTHSARSAEPPIRYTGSPTSSDSSARWDAPNHLTGVAAALLTAANHPAYPTIQDTTTALILPLPLSSLRKSDLASALTTSSPNLPFDLSGKSGAKARWDEQDDEPYSAPGMGRRSAKWAQGNARDLQGVEGMYM